MRALTTGFAFGSMLLGKAAAGMPPVLTMAQVLDFCASPSVQEAAARGDELGWQRMGNAQFEPWLASFKAHNDGWVEVVGWTRGPTEGDGSLSFWTAQALDGQRACSYSIADAPGLLEELSGQLGTPGNLYKDNLMTSASWGSGSSAIYFSQVASTVLVSITHNH